MEGLDPQILQDFLTESGELLAQLEVDLVELERAPDDEALVNQVFRALHTIKGSASFLDLRNLVTIAHAAESALNAARNKQAVIDRGMMDLLLRVVDLLKVQFAQVQAAEELTTPDPDLVAVLKLIGEGKQSSIDASALSGVEAPGVGQACSTNAAPADNGEETPLVLGPGKAELFDYLVADTVESAAQITQRVALLSDPAARSNAAGDIVEQCEALARSVEFFEHVAMTRVARALGAAAGAMASAGTSASATLAPRVRAMALLLTWQANGLAEKMLRSWPVDTLLARADALSRGEDVDDDALTPASSAQDCLEHDGVVAATGCQAHATAVSAVSTREVTPVSGVPAPMSAPSVDPASAKTDERKPAAAGVNAAEQTIRVEVGRLETLMNLVGELVLQKNRLSALIRKVGADPRTSGELREGLLGAAGGLDRITTDMQVAVLRTRMQPLDKLFGKYPRLIRDLAGKTGKEIELVIEGGETEVDKSVIEELGDPLVHLMRNAADHGLETPDERVKNGKSRSGTIRLVASNEGGRVSVQVRDDGRGLLRERIARKAVERGLTTADAVAAMPDREVFRFIFLPGFSTADQVSDLSGRGVGMDVVRTNIEKLKGTIDLWSEPGKGTTVSITLPLTVAIMPAMMVGVSEEIYAIPLTNIVEIVKPAAGQVQSIGEHPVLRLRDTVLPLVGAAQVFGFEGTPTQAPFVVVLSMNDRRCGLMVSRLIGQQEVVIKSLAQLSPREKTKARGPVAGATVRDDGGVSLIADVAELLRIAESQKVRKAA